MFSGTWDKTPYQWRRASCGLCHGLDCSNTAVETVSKTDSKRGTTIERQICSNVCSRSLSKLRLRKGPGTDLASLLGKLLNEIKIEPAGSSPVGDVPRENLRPELFIGMADTTSNAGQRRNFPPLALLIIIPVRPKAMEVRKTTINSRP
jgi:hypothetical protein